MIDANTIPAYLLGYPVSHSKSPLFQNAALQYLNINAVYLTMEIKSDEFDEIVPALKKMKILGLNITLPHKKAIMKYADSLNDDAKLIDAVNTIEIDGDKWIGRNTDWYGVYKTLEENTISPDQKVLIIGAGGATSGVIYGLQKYGIKDIYITNRSIEKAELLSKQFSINLISNDNYNNKLDNYSFIINTTTLEFDNLINKYNDSAVYFDLKYYKNKPAIKNYIDGSKMLLHQGAESFSIWTKKDAPMEIMRKALV